MRAKRLTPDVIAAIGAAGGNNQQIADQFGVSRPTVSRLRQGVVVSEVQRGHDRLCRAQTLRIAGTLHRWERARQATDEAEWGDDEGGELRLLAVRK